MTTKNFTKIMMVSAILFTASVFAKEASKTAASDKAKDAEKTIVAPVAAASITDKAQETPKPILKPLANDAVVAELEESRRVLMEMKAPRDQHMAEAGELAKQIGARRSTILTENEEAGKLNTDIVELDKTLQEKVSALQTIFDADKELIALQVKMQEARDNFGKNQLKLREEIARRHRERRLTMEAVKEKEAIAKAVANETSTTDEAAKNKTDQ